MALPRGAIAMTDNERNNKRWRDELLKRYPPEIVDVLYKWCNERGEITNGDVAKMLLAYDDLKAKLVKLQADSNGKSLDLSDKGSGW